MQLNPSHAIISHRMRRFDGIEMVLFSYDGCMQQTNQSAMHSHVTFYHTPRWLPPWVRLNSNFFLIRPQIVGASITRVVPNTFFFFSFLLHWWLGTQQRQLWLNHPRNLTRNWTSCIHVPPCCLRSIMPCAIPYLEQWLISCVQMHYRVAAVFCAVAHNGITRFAQYTT